MLVVTTISPTRCGMLGELSMDYNNLREVLTKQGVVYLDSEE